MTAATALWSFTLVVGLLTVTPGLDTTLILRTAAARRPRQAWDVVLGIQSGTLIWGVLTSAGVTALLTASQYAYQILRWAGAAYLLWLGIGMLWSSRRADESGDETQAPVPGGPGRFRDGWRHGALTNLLNPKMGAFYVALLPQFVPPAVPRFGWGVLLTGVHIALGIVWSALLIWCVGLLRQWLFRASLRRLLDRVAGLAVAGFGVGLALHDPAP